MYICNKQFLETENEGNIRKHTASCKTFIGKTNKSKGISNYFTAPKKAKTITST